MPVMKESADFSDENSTDQEEVSSRSNTFSVTSKGSVPKCDKEEIFNHPHAIPELADFTPASCFDNEGYEGDDSDYAITKEALKVRIHPLEPEDLKYIDNFSDPEMSIEQKLQSLQTLSLPEEQR
ncbi:hypothetical protein TNCT_232281, partial [Trichonephila clavata]